MQDMASSKLLCYFTKYVLSVIPSSPRQSPQVGKPAYTAGSLLQGGLKGSNLSAQQDGGFSLIEIIVVVLIIGILAAILGPNWLAFVNRQRVNKANDAILSALQQAQQAAKKNKRNYSVSFKVDSNVPKIAVYLDPNPASSAIPDSTSPLWKTIGQDIGIQSGQVLLYTNLDSTTANKASSNSGNVSYNAPGSGTITFDYMGTLPNANLGTPPPGSTDPPGLKVAVAVPKPGTTSAGNVKRCVIINTLIGGMRTAKDNTATDTNCN